jgi:hypothetical protein
MAQIEQIIENYLNKNAHIRFAYSDGLVNRRALARKIIEEHKTLSKSQFDAVIASLRRLNLEKNKSCSFYLMNQRSSTNSTDLVNSNKTLSDFTISIRDSIVIANLSRSSQTLRQIQQIFSHIPYDKNQIFKFVAGSDSAKLFLDFQNYDLVEWYIPRNEILYMKKDISEISLSYSDKIASQKGIISYISSSLFTNDIVIDEILTCSPQLLLYVNQTDSPKVYELLRRIQRLC